MFEELNKRLDAIIELLEKTYTVQPKGYAKPAPKKVTPTGRPVKVLTEEQKKKFVPAKKEPLARADDGDDGRPQDASMKAELLMKPPVSESQRRAMHAAAKGKSTLDIPKSVGKDFVDADEGGKLPEKKKKDEAEKADKTINYAEMNKPKKTPESQQATLTYTPGNPKAAPTYTPPTAKPQKTGAKPGRTQESSSAASSARIAEQKRKESLVPTKPPTAVEEMKARRAKMKKSEAFMVVTTETLTKSIRSQYSDLEITSMLKAAMDEGKIHRNVLVEWQNFQTINPSVIDLVTE